MAQAVNDSQLAYDNGEPATGTSQLLAWSSVLTSIRSFSVSCTVESGQGEVCETRFSKIDANTLGSYARHRADPYPALVNIGRKTGAYVKVYSEQYASSVASALCQWSQYSG